MPLDARKSAHIQAVINRTYAGRQKTVVFVYRVVGSYTYVATQVIFRAQNVTDPQVPALTGMPPGIPVDLYMIAPLATTFRGVVFVADTPIATAPAVASAARYEIIEAVLTGILPAGTHYRVALRRLR